MNKFTLGVTWKSFIELEFRCLLAFKLNISRLILVAKNRKALPLGPKIYYIVSPYRETEFVSVLYKTI